MPSVVADTHVLVWYLLEPARLAPRALERIRRATAAGDPILVATISLVEVVCLVEKGRLPDLARDRILGHLDLPDSDVKLVSLDREIAEAASRIPRDKVPDMPDRIVAATALCLGLPLVTRDGRIRAAGIEVIW